MNENIRIYVACLTAYNNGILHGAWIDANREAWAIYDDIRAMLRASPIPEAEEWAIHDYEGFEGAQISEYQGIESVAEIAAFIAENGELGGKALAHFGNFGEAREAIDDRYVGCYASVAEFVQQVTEETTLIPENLRNYIDYERMARDHEINDLFTLETGFDQVHVFWRA